MMILNALEEAYKNWPVHQMKQEIRIQQRNLYQYYVDRQVVVTGRGPEIDAVVEKVNTSKEAETLKISLAQLTTLNLDVMLRLSQKKTALTPIDMAGVEIRLYDLKSDNSEAAVWAAVRLVHEAAAGLGFIVLADPNLIVSNPASGGAGGVTGGPIGSAVGLNVKDAESRFWDQWAFQPRFANGSARQHGINLQKRQGPNDKLPERTIAETGQRAQVFVLDTADRDLLDGKPVTLPGQDQPVSFNAVRLKRSVQFVHDPTLDGLSAHGRFICGMVHRVAPEAEIVLLQLLDDSGRGELFTLTCALFLVIASELAENPPDKTRPLGHVVVNLSLSADLSEDRILMEGVRTSIECLWDAVEKKYTDEDALYRLLKDIYYRFYYGPSLRIPIMMLNSLGATIVAAAGNESADRYGNMPTLAPARYPQVIGVGASNVQGALSSYSNVAEIRAPGGGHNDPEFPITDLKRLHKQGKDLKTLGLYGLVPPTEENPSGLAYWWGTSFSTPLVAGLAALVIQKFHETHGRSPTPEEVMAYIKDNASHGIIDVKATLDAIK
jgi:hypothetical protein